MDQNVMISVKGTQKFLGEEPQSITIITEGNMTIAPDATYLSYDETEVSGMEGTRTTFKVQPGHVELTRSGAVESHMVFEKGFKDISLYDLGFGAMTIEVQARRLRNELGPRGGTLEISYGIDIERQARGINTFEISVTPKDLYGPQ